MMRKENQTVRVGQRFPQGLSVPEFYGSGALIGQNIEYRTLACYIYSKTIKIVSTRVIEPDCREATTISTTPANLGRMIIQ
jgi:hypothetical protein